MTKLEIATFAGGCFWCTEAVFQRLRGVTKVTSGYCQGAESVQVEFNPNKISYEKLLDVFFGTHDATQLNRQSEVYCKLIIDPKIKKLYKNFKHITR